MKRDWDLLRQQLISIEEESDLLAGCPVEPNPLVDIFSFTNEDFTLQECKRVCWHQVYRIVLFKDMNANPQKLRFCTVCVASISVEGLPLNYERYFFHETRFLQVNFSVFSGFVVTPVSS